MNSELLYNSITDIDPELVAAARPPKKRTFLQWAVPVASAAILLIGIFIAGYQVLVKPVTTIYITINPYLDIKLNRLGNVVAVEALNEDAETLLDGYVHAGRNRLQVATDIIERAEAMGYLAPGGTATISVETENSSDTEQITEDITNEIKGAEKVAKKFNINIRSMLSDSEAKALAMEYFSLESAQLKSIKCSAKHDVAIYSIKLKSGKTTYECEMDALTGEVLKDKIDGHKDDATKEEKPEDPTPEVSQPLSTLPEGESAIDSSQAEEIALHSYGISRDQATFIHSYNHNDGPAVVGIWVEFGYDGTNYKYLIDLTGNVVYPE